MTSEYDHPNIVAFTGTIRWEGTDPHLALEWSVSDAAFCRLHGEDTRYTLEHTGPDALRLVITPIQPLRSSYTLEAVGYDEATVARRIITVQYAINTSTAELDSAVTLHCTPEGHRVLILEASGIAFFDARTLQRLPIKSITPPDSTGVDTFALAPDGTALYFMSFGGHIYGYNIATLEILPGSGAYVAGGSEPPYQLTVNHDHTAIALITNVAEINNVPVGTNQLLLLTRDTFVPVNASPIATEHTLIHIVGHRSGRHYLGAPEKLRVLEPSTLEEPFAPLDLTLPGMLTLSPDEQYVYSVSFDPASKSFVLSKHHALSATLEAQVPIEIGFNPVFMALLGVPFAALHLSPDGTLLLVLGADPTALRRNQVRSSLLVFDAVRLEQFMWSPLQFDEGIMPIAATMSSDGSCIFVVAGERIGSSDSRTFLFRADPIFA